MTHTRSDIPTTSQPLPPRQRSWPVTLLSQRSVQVTLLAWLMANALFLVLAQDKLQFDRPALDDQFQGVWDVRRVPMT
jgi:hypothetical protein